MLVFFLPFAHAISQNHLPAVFEIKNDTADHHELDNICWQVLEDRSGKLTIDDVTGALISTLFHTDSSQTKGVDNSLHNYWFRVQLKNLMQKEVSISFSNEPYAEQFDLYIFRQGKNIQHQVSGVFIPYNKRDGFKDQEAIPVVLQPGEEVIIYKHMYKATQAYHAKDHLWLGFTFTDKLILNVYNNEDSTILYVILHSFTFGVLLLACLFNFFFFYINREKVYLYFASFLLFEGLVFFELLFLFFLRDYQNKHRQKGIC